MVPKPKFAEGEKVLCFHGPLIYEAKCLKSSVTKDNNVRYYIHYAGWNKNWDEWVPESRVLKYNEANIQRQKEVEKAHTVQSSRGKRGLKQGRKSETPVSEREETPSKSVTPVPIENGDVSTPFPMRVSSFKSTKYPSKESSVESGSEQSRKKKKIQDPTIESEEQYISKVEVKIKIPDELRVWLIDDWDVIIRQQKLITLPTRFTVEQIIDNYVLMKKSNKNFTAAKDSVLADFTNGLKDYFNSSLGAKLLYKFERPQYSEFLQDYPGTPPSKMYGTIHLLRLLTKLGTMLSFTSLGEKPMQTLQYYVQDFMKYLVNNRSILLNLKDYANATPEYHRKLQ